MVRYLIAYQNSYYCQVRKCVRVYIRIILSIHNKMQLYTVFFITANAVHVSGGFSAHHQELKNCMHSIGCMPSLLVSTASVGEFQLSCVYSF